MRNLIIAFCLLFPTFSYAGQSMGEMLVDIRYSISDSTITSHTSKYTDAVLIAKMNQVQREICRLAMPIYASQFMATTAGVQEYSISSDTEKIDKISFLLQSGTTNYQKLTFSTIQSLDTDRGINWENLPAARPMNYYLKSGVFGLVPAPSSSYSYASAMHIYYYQIPTNMVNYSDLPFNSIVWLQDYSNAIVEGVVWKCKKEKGMSWQDDYTMYNNIVGQLKSDVSNMRPDNSTINVQPKGN